LSLRAGDEDSKQGAIVPRDPLPGPFDFSTLLPTLTPAERLQLASRLEEINT
jgi:hypothetical protein